MKSNTYIFLVILTMMVFGLAGCASPPAETPSQISKVIPPEEASDLIKSNLNNPNFLIIDIRTPAEFAGGHLANAVNIDYYAADFKDKLSALDKSKTYLIYCRSGNRSANAMKLMAEMGFREVYDISGGIGNWQAEGLPVVK